MEAVPEILVQWGVVARHHLFYNDVCKPICVGENVGQFCPKSEDA
jgi:hypothetical protein